MKENNDMPSKWVSAVFVALCVLAGIAYLLMPSRPAHLSHIADWVQAMLR